MAESKEPSDVDGIVDQLETFYIGKSKETVRSYNRFLNKFLDYIKEEHNGEFSTRTIKLWSVALREMFSRASCGPAVYATRAFLKHLFKEEVLEKDLSIYVDKMPSYVPQVDRREQVEAFDIDGLLKGCETDSDVLFIKLLYASGMRIHELRKTQKCDFMKKGGNSSEGWKLSIIGKGNKKRVITIPFFEELEDALKPGESLYLFPGKRGRTHTSLARTTMQNKFKNICERAGMNFLTPHAIRHACATNLVESGLSVQKVSSFLGHGDVKTTARYLHSDLEDVVVSYVGESGFRK